MPEHPQENTDLELITRILGGDQDAYGALMRRIRGYAEYQLATVPAHDREEILAGVFAKVYDKLNTFDPAKSSFPTWVNTITRNAMIDHLRVWRRKDAETTLEEIASLQGQGEIFKDELQKAFLAEAREKVFAAINSIENELLRQYIVGTYVYMLTDDVLAEIFEVERSTVRSNLRRAHKSFFEKFDTTIPGGDKIDLHKLAEALRDGAVKPRDWRIQLRRGTQAAVLRNIFFEGRSLTATAEINGISVQEAVSYVREALLDEITVEKVVYRIAPSALNAVTKKDDSIAAPSVPHLLSAAFSSLRSS